MPPQGGRKHPHQEFIQVDTTNILFICGGAFAGLDKIIESRIGNKGVGFGADIRRANQKDMGLILGKVLPEDLLKYGLIPEFVGRLPVITSVNNLDESALVDILTKPKNALVRQYQRFFEFDGVELEFTGESLQAIAEQAILRGTGARGLRAIMEEVLLNVMYELPSREDVTKCLVDRDVVLTGVNPTLVPRNAPRRSAIAATSRANAPPRGLAMTLSRSLVAGTVTWARQHQSLELASRLDGGRFRLIGAVQRRGTHRRGRARCGRCSYRASCAENPSRAFRSSASRSRRIVGLRAARVPPAGRRRARGSAARPDSANARDSARMEGAVSHAASARTSSHRASRTSPPWTRHPAGRSSSGRGLAEVAPHDDSIPSQGRSRVNRPSLVDSSGLSRSANRSISALAPRA